MAQPFSPSLKERKRYVVYEPTNDQAVQDALTKLFGIRGAAHAGVLPIQHTDTRSILRVTHTSVDELKAAIAWIGARSITTSGTLKQARARL